MDGALTPQDMSPGLLEVAAPGIAMSPRGYTRESCRRRSRMVEISMSGSGEGLGWATGPGYSTARSEGLARNRRSR